MAKRIEDYKPIAALARFFTSRAYVSTCNKLRRDHIELHGCEPDFAFPVPFGFDMATYDTIQKEMDRFARRRRAAGSETVGYKRPPTATRWRPNQSGNPSGKRKERADGWDAFRSVRAQPVLVQTAGRRTSMNSEIIINKRVYEQAMKGDKKARCLIRQTLIELDQRSMLTPPAPRPRRRRVSAAKKEDYKALVAAAAPVVFRLAELQTMEEMEDTFRRVHGPNATFREDIQRERAVLLEHLRSLPAVREGHA